MDKFKDILNKYFNEIKETEIELIDEDNSTLYIDGIEHKFYDETRLLTIMPPEGMIMLHNIREDSEWIEIENLYNKVMVKCYKDGISYDKIKLHMSQYFTDANNNYISHIGIGNSNVLNICSKYPEFEIIDRKLHKLHNKIQYRIALTHIDYINSLKKYSDIKIEWKNNNNGNSKCKGYYFYLPDNGHDVNDIDFERLICKFLIKSSLISDNIKNSKNKIIFNKDINKDIYDIYLEIKKEKEEKIKTDITNAINTNDFRKIKELIEKSDLTDNAKRMCLELIFM